MSWSTRASGTGVPEVDVLDAITNKYIQKIPGTPAIPTQTNSYVWVGLDFETYITGNGNLTADTRMPMKSEIESWRLWDPADDIPSGLSSQGCAEGVIGVQLSWSDDPDIPTVDSSWARNQIETVIERSTDNVNFTALATVNYGTTSYNDAEFADCSTSHYYRLRYRNKTDNSMVGGATASVLETAGDGGIQ